MPVSGSDGLRGGTDNAADESEEVAQNKKPATAKDIAKAAHQAQHISSGPKVKPLKWASRRHLCTKSGPESLVFVYAPRARIASQNSKINKNIRIISTCFTCTLALLSLKEHEKKTMLANITVTPSKNPTFYSLRYC
jgi:hypothetical protein